jgi:flagellar basal-body rod modification protein FlgD
MTSAVSQPSFQAPGVPKQPTAPTTAITKQEFLELFVTQLRYQDPMNPQDPGEFTAQLAQMTSLEQLVNIKDGLDLLALAQTAGTSAQMVTFIGKDVAFNGGVVEWTETSSPVDIRYNLTTPSSELTVEISDASGQVIETRKLEAQGAGPQTFVFDGKKANGSPLTPGSYSVSITAKSATGEKVEVPLRATGHVESVTFTAGYPQLVLSDGRVLGLAQVSEVLEAGADDARERRSGSGSTDPDSEEPTP